LKKVISFPSVILFLFTTYLQTLPPATNSNGRPKKRQKVVNPPSVTSEVSAIVSTSAQSNKVSVVEKDGSPDSVTSLRRMIYGEDSYPEAHML
jgi:hypothetical protein